METHRPTHTPTHTLNLELTSQVCHAISLQYLTKTIGSTPRCGADGFCAGMIRGARPLSGSWNGSDRYLEEWMSRGGEEETSIFGASILMESQGRGPLWAPLLSAGGTCKRLSEAEGVSQRRVNTRIHISKARSCNACDAERQNQVAELITASWNVLSCSLTPYTCYCPESWVTSADSLDARCRASWE